MKFVVKLMEKGGKEKAFAGVLANPPHTTRQIMQPETYLAGEKIEPMRVPEFKRDFKDYVKFDIGAMGEFDVAVLIEQYAGKELSKRLYPEWRGGYYYAARPKNDRGRAAGAALCVAVVERGEGSRVCRDLCAVARAAVQEGGRSREIRLVHRRIAASGTQSRVAARAARLDHRGRHRRDRGAGRHRAGEREPGRGHDGDAGEGSVWEVSPKRFYASLNFLFLAGRSFGLIFLRCISQEVLHLGGDGELLAVALNGERAFFAG